MNPNTLVSIHGYHGDGHQVRFMLPYNLHHGCQVVIVSPEDSPIDKVTSRPEVQFRNAGKRQYIGIDSLIRQREQMRLLLKYPHEFFLMNDSDSICLSPKLPDYLYGRPDTFWSNIVSDEMHPRPAGYPYPRLAFQPPYFLHRGVMQKLVDTADKMEFTEQPQTPFIDWILMKWAVDAGVHYLPFPDGHSCPTNVENPHAVNASLFGVRENGHIFLHSIKTAEMLRQHAEARIIFLGRKR